ncbi:sigma-70 family RNA polymerase sigma factor [Moorena sp. SIO3H5]|uniref:RNA polymerase sigma factor n=1 Tax=Moorena sp. SIO3H5 TaxID=2607834 RepID=UPI0013BB0DE0|nr:sigma-70 family RNA polymerase sigma factor [Moorena sp. SIO3H5]NEO68330.1 sigma-70 family RNA polymerase sigma factor [Moorena sp. SIO3H5]
MQPRKPPKSPNRKQFDAAVNSLLNQREKSGLFAFIEFRLKQFNLEHKFDIFDIFIESYIRGVSKIESGQHIENPSAWLRTTCLNVIREHFAKKGKHWKKEREFSSIEYQISANDTSDYLSDQYVKEILSDIRQLVSPLDFDIFVLRVMEELSWIEIEERLNLASNAALRKRYQRMRKVLRDYFFDIDNSMLEDYGLS